MDTVKQLIEMTGCSEDDVVVALHDAQNDADRAVMILLEGGGVWEFSVLIAVR
jgi:translation elongation factor EF-Ts